MGIVKKSKSWERSCLLMGLTNFWGTRNNFGVIVSFVYTVFALFTFHILVTHRGPRGFIKKNYFLQAFNLHAETLGVVKKSQLHFHVV